MSCIHRVPEDLPLDEPTFVPSGADHPSHTQLAWSFPSPQCIACLVLSAASALHLPRFE